MPGHSDFIVYVDESGDHGLQSIDPQYPVFVLAFCIFHKESYRTVASPLLQELKFRYFGHDMVVLHEHDIRKAKGPFRFLVDAAVRERFLQDLNRLVEAVPLTLVASVIQKERLLKRYASPQNPYHTALGFGLERVASFLRAQGQPGQQTHFVFECRGKKEDQELAEEFERVCQGGNYRGERMLFQPTFADKKTNCCGLQLADLFARPIGRKVMNPGQPNRAFEVIEQKLYRQGNRVRGFGLKVFP
jgi:Protein of unknown function (DUF3800)